MANQKYTLIYSLDLQGDASIYFLRIMNICYAFRRSEKYFKKQIKKVRRTHMWHITLQFEYRSSVTKSGEHNVFSCEVKSQKQGYHVVNIAELYIEENLGVLSMIICKIEQF